MKTADIAELYEQCKNLEPFENSKTQGAFWDNEHISKMMLMAHLNPNWDAASRKPATIEATCNWIMSELKLCPGDQMLDLGCGPGLYTSRFCEKGLTVTGIDYSARSIDYAKDQARLLGQPINYIYGNYLELDYIDPLDAVVLIYCDFGVLSESDRSMLLHKIYKALKPGGYFVFDVWSTQYKELTRDYKSWSIHPEQGFWKPYPHVELILQQYNPKTHLALKQHLILQDEAPVEAFNLWEQCYTPETVSDLLINHGFRVLRMNSDLMGNPLTVESPALGIVAQRPPT